jgi:hypothetical protein
MVLGAIKPDQQRGVYLDERIDRYQSIGWTTVQKVVPSSSPAVVLALPGLYATAAWPLSGKTS